MGKPPNIDKKPPLEVYAKVREYHALGTELLKLFDKNGRRIENGRITEEAKKRKVPRTSIYRYTALARLYPDEKLSELAGLPWKVVKLLLRVKSGTIRSQLRQRFIAKKLSTAALEREVYQIRAREMPWGGRLKPGALQQDLVILTEKTRKWLHHVDRVWLAEHQTKLRDEPVKGSEQARLLKAAQAAMRRLMDSLT